MVEVRKTHAVLSLVTAIIVLPVDRSVAVGVLLGSFLMAANVYAMELVWAGLRQAQSGFWVWIGMFRFGLFLAAAWVSLEHGGADPLGLAIGVAALPAASVLAAVRTPRAVSAA